jgi:hypothetical protein
VGVERDGPKKSKRAGVDGESAASLGLVGSTLSCTCLLFRHLPRKAGRPRCKPFLVVQRNIFLVQ